MKTLIEFLQEFIKNKGHLVFSSALVSKICAFVGSWSIIRLLPENEFGVVTLVASIFAIFAPINGLGNHQSLLRFGSLTDNFQQKKAVSKDLFFNGLGYQIILTIGFVGCAFFYIETYTHILLLL